MQRCVEIGPVDAFTGEPFHADESREVRYDAKKSVKNTYNSFEETTGFGVCGYAFISVRMEENR